MTKEELDKIVGKYLTIRGTWLDEQFTNGNAVLFPGTEKPAARYSAFATSQEAVKQACLPIQQELEALGYEARTMPHSAKRSDGRRVPKLEIYLRLRDTN